MCTCAESHSCVEIVTETDNLDTEDSEEKKIEDDHMEKIIDTIKSRGHNTGRGGHELNQIKLQQDKTRRTTAWEYENKMDANKMLPGTWLKTYFP